MNTALGIDVGGSGIKGALVDLDKGCFIGERHRIETPKPATPKAVSGVIAQIIDHFEVGEDVPVGVCFPAPIPGGRVAFIANLDKKWTGKSVAEEVEKASGRKVYALNDADAAGVAEMAHGVGKTQRDGVTVFTTLGTGIGSAVFLDGQLVPNTELGHLEIDGKIAEKRAAASIRKLEDLSWPEFAARLQRYYSEVVKLFSPRRIIVGGGVSRKHEKFLPLIDVGTPITAAELRNTAGIIGAATFAAKCVAGQS